LILEEAERLFAAHGFAATRLEDVAQAVGIRRASIVYYFRNKAELYDAVLGEVVHGLYVRVEPELFAPGDLTTRIEATVTAFVDFIVARPTAPRILLRELADGNPEQPPRVLRHFGEFAQLIGAVMERDGELPRFPKADPLQLGSAIAGMSIFYLVAVPTFLPGLTVDPLAPEQIEALKAEVRRTTRRLLGVNEP
jgi:TetR/AcrR family transcriptional regulator